MKKRKLQIYALLIFPKTYDQSSFGQCPVVFYRVFDGHGGKNATHFVNDNLSRFIIENPNFSLELEKEVIIFFTETDKNLLRIVYFTLFSHKVQKP